MKSLAVLHRLGQMNIQDRHAAGQVGDGAGRLENAMVGARGVLKLLPGCAHEVGAGLFEQAGLELCHQTADQMRWFVPKTVSLTMASV